MHEGDDTKHAHATWGDWDEGREFLMFNLYPAAEAGPTKTSIGFAVDDLDAVHARLVSAGAIVIRAPERRPWGASATYRDPDGNTLSLTEGPRAKG
jgi:predicted enzyme related to lactoylglutathione lyase